jgi:protein-ribulosamine 3-kinase
MADVEFGTEFPELHLLTLEEATIDGEVVECVVVDENVIASRFRVFLPKSNVGLISWLEFPQGTHSITATSHGSSMWTQTARVSTTLPDGTPKSYFLKVAAGALGLGMVEGEYESIAAIHAVKPGFCPKPQAL